MILFQAVLSQLTYFGSLLSLLLAIQQITGRKRELANYLRFCNQLCNTIILYDIAFIASRFPIEYPWIIFIFFTAIFLHGPSYILSINAQLGTKTKLNMFDIVYISPVILVFVGEIVFQFQDVGFKQEVMRVFLTTPLQSPLSVLIVISALYAIAYDIRLIQIVGEFWNNSVIKNPVRIVGVRVMAAFLVIILLTAGILLSDPILILLAGTMQTGIQVFIFITQDYYPQFFFALKREMQKKRYERSLLRGFSTEVINNRLEELMKDERLYRDMDLNLQSLANRLSLTPHQLSQFLNDQLNSNFRNYINHFRVEEAIILLEHNPEKSISSIQFEVGFNSKSAFNLVFKKATGKTAQEYRRRFEKR